MNKTEDPNYRKKWYDQNKDILLAKLREKEKCSCGTTISLSSKGPHLNSLKHKTIMEIIKNKQKGGKKEKVEYIDPYDILKKAEEYAPKGTEVIIKGKSKLDKINASQKLIQEKVDKMIKDGRVEIHTRDQLMNFPLGSLVSYITKDGDYRSGGFLKALQKEYFVLQGGTNAHPISFSVQFRNIAKMFVKIKDIID